jgi:membrane peptidoglycan carboxypeptidase
MTGSGTGTTANPHDGTAFLGKTGTTNNSVQTWIVASSTKAATAVWVGNISGMQQLRKITVNHTQAALLRHAVFRSVMTIVDRDLGPAPPFAIADPSFSTGGKYVQQPSGSGGVAPPAAPAAPVPVPTPTT